MLLSCIKTVYNRLNYNQLASLMQLRFISNKSLFDNNIPTNPVDKSLYVEIYFKPSNKRNNQIYFSPMMFHFEKKKLVHDHLKANKIVFIKNTK